MTIASLQIEAIGARVFTPEGPLDTSGRSGPLPNFKAGEVFAGDAEAEYVYLIYSPVAAVTVNQGDFMTWDNSYQAVLTPAAAAGSISFGANVGTFFLGGRLGDPAAAPNSGNSFSYLFPQAGSYGVWVQRAGTSLLNLASVNAQTKPMGTSATVGKLDQPSAALANSMGVTGAYSAPTTGTFTGTTVNGSANLTAVSTNKFLVVGQTLSGTGIATGAVITGIAGNIVTMSLAATASGTVTITAANMSTYVTTTNGSPVLTNVTSIAGIYPNQTIAGTGIPGSTTIVSITGNAAPYTITMSANATATANNINATTTGYWEGYLRWPYVASQN